MGPGGLSVVIPGRCEAAIPESNITTNDANMARPGAVHIWIPVLPRIKSGVGRNDQEGCQRPADEPEWDDMSEALARTARAEAPRTGLRRVALPSQ